MRHATLNLSEVSDLADDCIKPAFRRTINNNDDDDNNNNNKEMPVQKI